MNDYGKYITIDRSRRFGKACIKGTRIAVSDILKWLASGMTEEDILNEYPLLKKEHILAALSYAANRETITSIIGG